MTAGFGSMLYDPLHIYINISPTQNLQNKNLSFRHYKGFSVNPHGSNFSEKLFAVRVLSTVLHVLYSYGQWENAI